MATLDSAIEEPRGQLQVGKGGVQVKEKTVKRYSKNRKFTKEEDDRLRELVKLYGEGHWIKVAEKMPGRNRKQVRERYVNFVKKERSFAEFTVEEDSLILGFVQTKGRRWILISNMLPGRTPIMIKNRYYAKLRHLAKPPKLPNEPSESALGANL
eukprot:TRINITY_DN1023_c0_g2_i16.p2 TRINITY_DN1023_c0_g2~~TRINITY_DN1023_c0_g2_i16.p2  ORF type:complete len:155 (+),score=43.37 TRINITY_DN1023_c0_g2_i16:508-972(+)